MCPFRDTIHIIISILAFILKWRPQRARRRGEDTPCDERVSSTGESRGVQDAAAEVLAGSETVAAGGRSHRGQCVDNMIAGQLEIRKEDV